MFSVQQNSINMRVIDYTKLAIAAFLIVNFVNVMII